MVAGQDNRRYKQVGISAAFAGILLVLENDGPRNSPS